MWLPCPSVWAFSDAGYSIVPEYDVTFSNTYPRFYYTSIEVNNNSFTSTTSLEMDGDAVAAELFARFDGEQVEGTLKLQNSEELPFTGTKD